MRKPLEALVFSARAPVALKERFPEKGTVSRNPSKTIGKSSKITIFEQ